MANKCLILMIFSCLFVWLCQGRVGGGGGGGGDQPPCMKELLPCKAYLHQPSAPKASCCVPLIKFVSTAAKCLCDVLTNPAIMFSFNATHDDALHLAKGCGASVDKYFCNNDASTTTVSSSPSDFSSPSLGTNFTAGGAQSKFSLLKKKKKNKMKKKKKKSAASPVSKFRGSSVLVVLYGVFVVINV